MNCKVWDYDYNAFGKVTQVSIANGMTTAYTYDNRNRLTKIDHKDGSTVVDGFTYGLDKEGNITKATYQDTANRVYGCDGRDWLTLAERKDYSNILWARIPKI